MKTNRFLAFVTALGVGIFGWISGGKAMERRASEEDRTFPVPGGGEVHLPGRFVVDRAAEGDLVGAAFLPDDLLLAYGKRRWNIGGNAQVAEAIAVGTQAAFPDLETFRREAAHYLKDADWRGPAREALQWEEIEGAGFVLREARLAAVGDRRVLLGWKEDVPIWVAAFVTPRERASGLAAMKQALESYRVTE